MNNLKYGVLLCGLAGIAACFIPDGGASFFDARTKAASDEGGWHVYAVLAAFVVPAIMAIITIIKAPMQRFHALVSLFGFAFVLVKFRSHFMDALKDGGINMKLMMIVPIVGILLCIAAMAKPETAH